MIQSKDYGRIKFYINSGDNITYENVFVERELDCGKVYFKVWKKGKHIGLINFDNVAIVDIME